MNDNNNCIIAHCLAQQNNQVTHRGSIPGHIIVCIRSGQYAGRSGSPTIILEAVADYDIWI
ncbi:hypothetical protein UlMin_036105 [Ulmus minor]